ncbi:MAG: hypothetical protein K8H89_01795 [Flavobacteriales bacterium]|jgi:hypothetical protein|nr:hypothetical protein [Flavobacteriales bacterium]
MKRALSAALIPALFAPLFVAGQTITSVSNGLFYFPTTWDCLCIPAPQSGQNVVIDHLVTLNNAIGVYGGTLTIHGQGALLQDGTPRQLHVNNGGSVVNQGTFTVDQAWVQNGSINNTGTATIHTFLNEQTLTNAGLILGVDSFLNNGAITNGTAAIIEVGTFQNNDQLHNLGTIQHVDSLFNTGWLHNDADAMLQVDSLLNTGTLINDGTMQLISMMNAGGQTNGGTINANDLLNTGTFENHGSMLCGGSLANMGNMTNHPDAEMQIEASFLNADQDPPVPFGQALFTNNGSVQVDHSWYNFAHIAGDAPGSFVVQDSTVNAGALTGTFDLCDLSPQTTVPPIIDLNIGTVEPGITYCTIPSGIGATQRSEPLLRFDPTTRILILERPQQTWRNARVRVHDALARMVRDLSIQGTTSIQLDLSTLRAGTYLVTVTSHGGTPWTTRLVLP